MPQFIYPYLLFENTLEAAEYYKKVFDAHVTYTMLGKDSPDCPEEYLESVYHLQLKFQETEIYMADFLEKEPMEPGNMMMLLLDYSNLDVMKKAFNNMAKDGTILQELNETFWGAVFGMIRDKYGYAWEFHYTIPKE